MNSVPTVLTDEQSVVHAYSPLTLYADISEQLVTHYPDVTSRDGFKPVPQVAAQLV